MLESTIAHYKITAKLGQGGMGEVYRATDTKLDREVAIKVLPEFFAQDKERLARFEREAKVLASLNHPNIASIYGLEQTGDSHALVLELVEGETLTERLRTGAMPVEEALDVCKQIAEALDAAHEKGIIHRDLKPGNVKITPEGKVKVLDFGLAKAVVADSSAAPSDNSQSPTLTADYTRPGVILGTAAYMSPEQARGKPVDKRSDNWSFGCVLYECLSGKRLFHGEDVTETLATVIKGEPDWTVLPPETPAPIQLLLRKCLSKDRKRRLHDIADARVDLEQAIADPSSSFIRLNREALRETSTTKGMAPLTVAGLVFAVAVLAIALTWFLKPIPPARYAIASDPVPKLADLLIADEAILFDLFGNNGFALSRDGNLLVYVLDNQKGLRFRNLVTGQDGLIPGTEDLTVRSPFFSGDGDKIGFLQGPDPSLLTTIPVTGGKPRALPNVGLNEWTFLGADWSRDGRIVFAQEEFPLRIISEEGGVETNLTTRADGEGHAFPRFLDDGDHVAFSVSTGGSVWSGGHARLPKRIEIVNTATSKTKVLTMKPCDEVRYTASGHLLCSSGSQIHVVQFDFDKMEPVGPRKLVQDGIRNSGRAQFDVADDGTLVFLPGYSLADSMQTLVWMDFDRKIQPYTRHQGKWDGFSVSPDYQRVALEIQGDLWILNASAPNSPPPRPLVQNPALESNPVWSADGEYLYFYSDRDNQHGIWRKKANFDGSNEELVYGSDSARLFPTSASTNWLILTWVGDASFRGRIDIWSFRGNIDVWKLALNKQDAQPEPLLTGPAREHSASISPDEKWLAYCSNEAGTEQLYIRPMDGPGSQIISSGREARVPFWSKDGATIFWRDYGDHFYAELTKDGNRVMPTSGPRLLFGETFFNGEDWAISADGKRALLMPRDTRDVQDSSRISSRRELLRLITHWFTELNAKVPSNGK